MTMTWWTITINVTANHTHWILKISQIFVSSNDIPKHQLLTSRKPPQLLKLQLLLVFSQGPLRISDHTLINSTMSLNRQGWLLSVNAWQSPLSPTMQHSSISQVSNVSMKPFWNARMFLLVSLNFTCIATDLTCFAGYWLQYHKELCVLVSTLHFVFTLFLKLFSLDCLHCYHSFGRHWWHGARHWNWRPMTLFPAFTN